MYGYKNIGMYGSKNNGMYDSKKSTKPSFYHFSNIINVKQFQKRIIKKYDIEKPVWSGYKKEIKKWKFDKQFKKAFSWGKNIK